MIDAPNLNAAMQDLPYADLLEGVDIGNMTPEEANAHIDKMLAGAFGPLAFSIFNHGQQMLAELKEY